MPASHLLCRSFILLFLPFAAGRGAEVNVRTVGAIGDGHTDDTAAIRRAVDEVTAAGGGTVHLSAGTYVCGSIRLRSNLTLFLESGAVLQASEDPKVFELPEPNDFGDRYQYQDFGHRHWRNSLLWAENEHDITIAGPGLIYGKGLARGIVNDDNAVLPHANKAIALKNCRNVTLADFSLLHGGWFGILATGADNLTIRNLRIDTDRDGIDVDCCRNIRISDCSVNSPGDDGICLKSSYALDTLRATENVTITNCQVSGYDEGTLLDGTFQRKVRQNSGPTGRIKLGTESNGGFKNITISNCVFEYCRGLALEVVDGGSIEDVTITNITMRDIVNSPIFIIQGARLRGPAGTAIAAIRRVQISHLVASNVTAKSGILILGRPEKPIEDISLSHLTIAYAGGGTKEETAIKVPDQPTVYPEPDRFGVLPAYGLFARDVTNLNMDHLRFFTATPDARPVMQLESVADACLESSRFATSSGAEMVRLCAGSQLETHRVAGLADGQYHP